MSAVQSDRGISIFFPAFNDAVSIETLVRDALEIIPSLTNDYEIIVVNDGSTDATAAVLERLARDDLAPNPHRHELAFDDSFCGRRELADGPDVVRGCNQIVVVRRDHGEIARRGEVSGRGREAIGER